MNGDAARDDAARDDAARERHVAVPRTARYFALGEAAGARELWVGIHGYGQLASYFVRHFAAHAEGRLILAPEGLSRFYLESRADAAEGSPPHSPRVGATWMTREDRAHEIADYVRWLDLALDDAVADADIADVPLGVLAFSQGTATACRWLQARARHGMPPAARLVLWAGGVPPDLDLDAEWLRRTRLTLVVGTEDPFATPAAAADLRATLDARDVPYDEVTFTGGHRIERETLARVLSA